MKNLNIYRLANKPILPLVLNIRVPWVIVLRCVDAENRKRTIPFNKTC